MNYQETLEYLYNRLPTFQRVGGIAYKEGLGNSHLLDDYYGHPHRHYKTIHVAGTNGKGSCSHLLAAVLQQAGYKVGLYTSPHLLDFNERIRVNGAPINEKYVIDFVANNTCLFENISCSFFELTMMMAFKYFEDSEVDIAIIEVGLGGRLDSTNIIHPELCLITNIGLDHMEFLGNTLEKIAVEKAGIIKPYIPVVIGEATGTVRSVFEDKAKKENAPILFAQDYPVILKSEYVNETENWFYETVEYGQVMGELGGFAQPLNSNAVLCAIEQLKKLGYSIPNKAVLAAFSDVTQLTGLQGRWQIVSENPRVILDTGHNAHGFKHIVEQLNAQTYHKLHIIVGFVNDKDINSILKMLPKNAIYYFTKASITRALDVEKLQGQAIGYGLNGLSFERVDTAIQDALNKALSDDLIFIGGSNFIVAEALAYLKK